MSEPDEKLDRVVTSEGLPRATLEQLLKMWGGARGHRPEASPGGHRGQHDGCS
jgi:hypothetical protein